MVVSDAAQRRRMRWYSVLGWLAAWRTSSDWRNATFLVRGTEEERSSPRDRSGSVASGAILVEEPIEAEVVRDDAVRLQVPQARPGRGRRSAGRPLARGECVSSALRCAATNFVPPRLQLPAATGCRLMQDSGAGRGGRWEKTADLQAKPETEGRFSVKSRRRDPSRGDS